MSSRYSLTALALLLLAGPAVAQQQPVPTPAGPVPTANQAQFRPNYVLGPGDQIIIRAADAEEMSDKPFRIDSDGFVTLPLVGKVRVGGLNLDQLEAELVARLKVYIRNPQVTVSVAQYRAEPVFFVGAFKSPGIYPLQGRHTLVEMLAAEGGLQPTAGRRIKLTRRQEMGPIPLPNAAVDPVAKTTSVEISLGSLEESVNPAEDIVLQPFDVISVERAEVVYVSGDVMRGGAIELGERDFLTVLQVLSLSGGIGPEGSQKVRVLRPIINSGRRAEIDVDVKKILNGQANDFPLLSNDMLFVPHAGGRVMAERAATMSAALASAVVSALAFTSF